MKKTTVSVTVFAVFATVLMLSTTVFAQSIDAQINEKVLEEKIECLVGDLGELQEKLEKNRDARAALVSLKNDRELNSLMTRLSSARSEEEKEFLIGELVNIISAKKEIKQLELIIKSSEYQSNVLGIASDIDDISNELQQSSDDDVLIAYLPLDEAGFQVGVESLSIGMNAAGSPTQMNGDVSVDFPDSIVIPLWLVILFIFCFPLLSLFLAWYLSFVPDCP